MDPIKNSLFALKLFDYVEDFLSNSVNLSNSFQGLVDKHVKAYPAVTGEQMKQLVPYWNGNRFDLINQQFEELTGGIKMINPLFNWENIHRVVSTLKVRRQLARFTASRSDLWVTVLFSPFNGEIKLEVVRNHQKFGLETTIAGGPHNGINWYQPDRDEFIRTLFNRTSTLMKEDKSKANALAVKVDAGLKWCLENNHVPEEQYEKQIRRSLTSALLHFKQQPPYN